MGDRFRLPPLPAFQAYTEVEQLILERVRRWFYEAPFFVALREGRLTPAELRHFTAQYGHYSRHFPRVLGAAVAAMAPDDAYWVPIADNLWDEAGRGQPEHAHSRLYARFMHSVDPALSLDREPMGPAVEKAITTFLAFFRRATTLEAMAAVGLGSELFAGQVMGWIEAGLRHPAYQPVDRPLDLTFWHVHVVRDEPRHYHLCRTVLIRHTAPEELRIMARAGLSIAASEARMYQEIYQESQASA
ncbi:MAG: iron-containing redox enzyme family protein [Firmicutes bacterium]|nr:iron-containing redox enzyme family protein [Alicyclobacillaceae bacterium]MCL6497124.1 iron-containing redox enzyme family protein [Bacillota bacterium]